MVPFFILQVTVRL